MNTLSFDFKKREVQYVKKADQIWFSLVDVLNAIKSTTDPYRAAESVRRGLGDEFVSKIKTKTSGGTKALIFVSEPGATFLLANSNTPEGRQLNRYIHGTLLPNLRRSGALDKPHMPIEVIFDAISIRSDTSKAKFAMTMARQQCDDLGDLLGSPLRTDDDVVNSLGAHIFIRALSHFVNPIRNGFGLSESDIVALERVGMKDIDRLQDDRRKSILRRR